MNCFPFKILILLVIFGQTDVASATEQALTLEHAIVQVQQSAVISARQALAKAWSFKPAQMGSLPDPVLSLAAISFPVNTWHRNQESMTQLRIGISQALPFPGKLAEKAAAASHMAKAATYDLNELKIQLVSQVQVRWWNLFYADRALAIVAKNQVLLRQFIRVAATKYKVGKGLQQDVLLAQLELSKLLDSEIQWLGVRDQEQARLNALLNQKASQAIVLPQAVNEALPRLASEEVLMQQAMQLRPVLAKEQQYIQAAQSQENVAEKGFYPDFKLGASYAVRAADPITGLARANLASITLSMTIPFGASPDAQLGQRQAEVAQAKFSYRDMRAKVQAEVGVEVANYQRAKEQASLFQQGIIPQAQQTVASMLAAYQVNKVDFLNLVRTQITLYNYENQYWNVLVQAKQSLARLDAALGKQPEYSHE